MSKSTTSNLTYQDVLMSLMILKAGATQEAENYAGRQADSKLDELAALGLDAGTLSDLAAIDDAIGDQEKAAWATVEVVDVAVKGLQRRHAAIAEAAQTAPAEMAESEFYT